MNDLTQVFREILNEKKLASNSEEASQHALHSPLPNINSRTACSPADSLFDGFRSQILDNFVFVRTLNNKLKELYSVCSKKSVQTFKSQYSKMLLDKVVELKSISKQIGSLRSGIELEQREFLNSTLQITQDFIKAIFNSINELTAPNAGYGNNDYRDSDLSLINLLFINRSQIESHKKAATRLYKQEFLAKITPADEPISSNNNGARKPDSIGSDKCSTTIGTGLSTYTSQNRDIKSTYITDSKNSIDNADKIDEFNTNTSTDKTTKFGINNSKYKTSKFNTVSCASNDQTALLVNSNNHLPIGSSNVECAEDSQNLSLIKESVGSVEKQQQLSIGNKDSNWVENNRNLSLLNPNDSYFVSASADPPPPAVDSSQDNNIHLENQLIFDSLVNRNDHVETIVKQVAEISNLQTFFSDQIYQQSEKIDQILDSAKLSYDVIGEGNKHLKKADKNLSEYQRWIIMMLLSMIFSLLFLHYYSP